MTLDIIGPGFGRTGTKSLKIALEHLGFGPAHHMFEIRDNPSLLKPWQDYLAGKGINWDSAFAGYRSQVDWPGAAVWRDLVRDYPEARVILTVRDPDAWFDSVQGTIMHHLAGRETYPDPFMRDMARMANELVNLGVFDGKMDDRAHATGVLRDHVKAVQAEVAPERLLVFDVAQGWAPLCRFLGVAVPDITFPHLNSSRQFVDEEWENKLSSGISTVAE